MKLEPVWRYHLRLGDRFLRKNEVEHAVFCYLKAAEVLMAQEYFSMAAAVYGQVLRLDQSRTELGEDLNGLYDRFEVKASIRESYQDVVVRYENEGKFEQAREIIRILLDLKPKEIITAIDLAEYY